MNDNSPSPFLRDAAFVTHIFRMSLFFFIAGYLRPAAVPQARRARFLGEPRQRILIPLVVGWVGAVSR